MAELRRESSLPYSTTEQLTGETWIDGKPIYSKVFTGTVTATSGTASTIILSQGVVDSLIGAKGEMVYNSTNNNKWLIGSHNYTNAITGYVYRSSSSYNLEFASTTNAVRTNAPYAIVVEYTKL